MFAQICELTTYGAFGDGNFYCSQKSIQSISSVSQRRHLTQKALQSLMFYNK
jgi:hypothetical protein